MNVYSVTYSDPEAFHPAPKMNTLIECTKDEIWDEATKLGLVQTIYDCSWDGPVYSIHWKHNHLGVSNKQVMETLEF